MKHVLLMNERSKSISVAGALQLIYLHIYIPPFLDEKGADADLEVMFFTREREGNRRVCPASRGDGMEHVLQTAIPCSLGVRSGPEIQL
jgi:hypothetical protein